MLINRILIVDDEPVNLHLLNSTLAHDYSVSKAFSGEEALRLAHVEPLPDLILLDVMMPGMDGFEVCEKLKSDPLTRDIPVIFVTAKIEMEDEARGFELGAVDYIQKPVSPPLVLARVKTHLQIYDQKKYLEEKVRERTEELQETRDVTIFSLAALAETRDNETGDHIQRTRHYVRLIAEGLLKHPLYEQLDSKTISLMEKSAPLHDIGKVGIQDHILLKPGKLTSEEFEIMKTHVAIGRNALLRAERAIGKTSGDTFLRMAREIAYSHHEKWNGTGYMEGVAGLDIPLSARIMAVSDVYDALISRRVYKAPMPHEQAVKIIAEGRGSHFDPDIVNIFLEIEGSILKAAYELTTLKEEKVSLENSLKARSPAKF